MKTATNLNLSGIDHYNVADFVAGTDLESLSLKQLAEVWPLLRNMCESEKRRMMFKAEVRGRFIFTSDIDGSFRFGSGESKQDVIRDIRRMPASILSNRQARVRSAFDAVACHVNKINRTTDALTVSMERIELRILKGDLIAA